MNVGVWGVDAWDVLHGLAYLVRAPEATCLFNFLQALRTVLPCIYCRNSYGPFLDSVVPDARALADAVSRGRTLELMYRLHNLVNEKLDGQRLDGLLDKLAAPLAADLGVSTERVKAALTTARPTLLPAATTVGKTPKLHVVETRMALRFPRVFHTDALFRLFLIFTLNATPDTVAALTTALRCIASIVAPHAAYADLVAALGRVTAARARTPRDLFSALLREHLSPSVPPPPEAWEAVVDMYWKLFETARANRCVSGGCH
jgi:hypothetical protein